MQTAESSTQDVYGLHAKLDRKNTVEVKNETAQDEFRRKFAESVDALQQRLVDFSERQRESSIAVQQDIGMSGGTVVLVEIYTQMSTCI